MVWVVMLEPQTLLYKYSSPIKIQHTMNTTDEVTVAAAVDLIFSHLIKHDIFL